MRSDNVSSDILSQYCIDIFRVFFHINLGIGLFDIHKITFWDFGWNYIEIISEVGRTKILIIIILPNHEHGIFLHLFGSHMVLFIRVLWVFSYRNCTYFVSFILEGFILGGDKVSGIVFLISYFAHSLLVYRKATDFIY